MMWKVHIDVHMIDASQLLEQLYQYSGDVCLLLWRRVSIT